MLVYLILFLQLDVMSNNNGIKNILNKNRVLDNESNYLSKIHFDNFHGEKNIEINAGGYMSNGYIFVDAVNVSDLKIYYKNILIMSTDTAISKIIPILFENDTYFKIIGNIENLSIYVYGAEIIKNSCCWHLPQNQMIIRSSGGQYDFCKYDSINDLIDNDVTMSFQHDSIVDVQSVKFDSLYISYLYNDNGLYFCTNIDNYTQKYWITDSSCKAKIVPDFQNNSVIIVYIKDNRLYYKTIDENFNISEESHYDISFDEGLIDFCNVVINDCVIPVFGVVLKNKKSLIMCLYKENIVCRLIKKSNNCVIYLDSNSLEVYVFENNELSIEKYEIIDDSSDVVMVNSSFRRVIYNVDQVIKLNNNYLLYNRNFCTVINENELFTN